jgi:hypothetical protein
MIFLLMVVFGGLDMSFWKKYSNPITPLEPLKDSKTHFIFFNGVIGWGIPSALIWSLLMWACSANFNVALGLPVALILFPLGGLAVGWIAWHRSQKAIHGRHERDQS